MSLSESWQVTSVFWNDSIINTSPMVTTPWSIEVGGGTLIVVLEDYSYALVIDVIEDGVKDLVAKSAFADAAIIAATVDERDGLGDLLSIELLDY